MIGIMDIDESLKESSDSTLAVNSVRSNVTDADTKYTTDQTMSKNGASVEQSNNGILSPGTISSPKAALQSTGTNGVRLSYKIDDYVPPSSKSTHDLRNTFSWEGMLKQPEFVAAPVSAFRHAPMSDCWENIIVGMKVCIYGSGRIDEHPHPEFYTLVNRLSKVYFFFVRLKWRTGIQKIQTLPLRMHIG